MRKWDIALFALFTLGCTGWILFNWWGLHLLVFDCEDPTGQLTCDQVIERAFAWRAGATILVWGLAGWLTFRKRGTK